MNASIPIFARRLPDRASLNCYCVGSRRPVRHFSSTLPFTLVYPVLVFSCSVQDVPEVRADSSPISQIYVQKAEKASAEALDLFFFEDEEGNTLDSYQRVDEWDGAPVGGASRSGRKVLVALANYAHDRYAYGAMNCLQSLSRISFQLSSESPQRPLMSGRTNIIAGEKCSLELSPSLASITLNSICCDFSKRPYSGSSLKDVNVYLTNVCSEYRPLSSESLSWINMGMYSPSDAAGLSHPEMLKAHIDEVTSSVLFPNIVLYCYPNEIPEESLSVHFTRIVIDGTIGGIHCYYPININREDFGYVSGPEGIAPGKNYALDITLTRIGTEDPDTPVSSATVTVKTTVRPWNEFPEYTVLY